MMPGNALAIEVWNGPWESFNQESLQLFYRWLNAGHRVTATSGTDLHGPPPIEARGAVNAVYAADLTETAIIEAVKAGHSYITAGPELLLNVTTVSGISGMVGDTVPAEDAVVSIDWDGAHAGDYVRLFVNGRAYHDKLVTETGRIEWTLPAGHARWCTVELRDGDDGLWAVTNPIFFAAGR